MRFSDLGQRLTHEALPPRIGRCLRQQCPPYLGGLFRASVLLGGKPEEISGPDVGRIERHGAIERRFGFSGDDAVLRPGDGFAETCANTGCNRGLNQEGDLILRKAGLASTSRSRRSAAGRRALGRMARLIRPTWGRVRSSFSTMDLPRKPVVPVTSSVRPAMASSINGTILWGPKSPYQSRMRRFGSSERRVKSP